MKRVKLVYFGTSDFSVPILRSITENGYEVILVVTTPDRKAGRGRKMQTPPVKETATLLTLPTIQPETLSDDMLPEADIFIIASYGKILPRNIVMRPPYGTLNIHPSLLPRYRGPSPIQTAILNGDETTGVTIMLTDEKMDHGPILAQKKVHIADNDTALTLAEKLSKSGADLLIHTIPDWISGAIRPKSQNHEEATFTKLIKKENGEVNWSKPADQILREIRAYAGWPSSWTEIETQKGNIRIKIISAHKNDQGILTIDSLQPEGKKVMSGNEFKRGYTSLTSPYFVI